MGYPYGSNLETASWSISIEWFLYLLFPFLAFIIHKNGKYAMVILGLISFVFLFVICYYIEPQWIEEISKQRKLEGAFPNLRPTNTIDIITGFALLRGFCSFIFGMLTYEFYTRKLFKKILEKGFWFPLVWVLLFLCWINDILLDPFAILIFSVLILHASYADGLLKKLLNNRVFTYLGDISYSIYMVHIPIIITLFIVSLINGEMATPPKEISYMKNWIGAIIFLSIVIVIASCTYWFIEKPMRKMLKKL